MMMMMMMMDLVCFFLLLRVSCQWFTVAFFAVKLLVRCFGVKMMS